MIPDKVYVKKERNNAMFSLSVQYDNGGDVYIRKDALLERLEQARQIPHIFGQQRDSAFREVIDIIKSF